MQAEDCCEYLEWDSNFWSRRVARARVSRLGPETLQHVFGWCEEQRVDCLYFLADADDAQTVRLAEDSGFRFVDVRLTMERQLADIVQPKAHGDSQNIENGSRQAAGDSQAGDSQSIEGDSRKAGGDAQEQRVRLFKPDDLASLREIARVSHRDSRFYFDARFPDALCDRLYKTWIENSCRGYADAVLVAEHGGRAAGYISCHLAGDAGGEIGLVGVLADAQGLGLGLELVREALRWFASRAVRRVTVVTQGRNQRAQRLYQKCGFKTQSVRLWYHRWFPGREL